MFQKRLIILLIVFGVIFFQNIAAKADDNYSKEKALEYKNKAEYFIQAQNYKEAAEYFIKTLSIYRDFSEQEKIQMANYIAWGGRLKEAIQIVLDIIEKNPNNLQARVNLAKFLSWAGRLDESMKEVEIVLSNDSNNTEARFVKANVLRWKGKPEEAIPIYESLLKEKEDFDVRLSYNYALLSIKEFKKIKETLSLLKPSYLYQEKDLKEFKRELNSAVRPKLEFGISYYHDEDYNDVNKYYSNLSFLIDNINFRVGYTELIAKNSSQKNKAHIISGGISTKITEKLNVSAAMTYYDLANSTVSSIVGGYIDSNFKIGHGHIGVLLSKEALTDTTELISNGIWYKNVSFYIFQKLTDKWAIYGRYSYRDYSDNNFCNDIIINPRYIPISGNFSFTIGYAFRYLDFARQSRGGYFDPKDFISNQLIFSFSYTKESFYAYLEPYFGYQSYKRYAKSKNEFFVGGSGVLRYRVSDILSVELNAEGGNYGTGSTGGWMYYLIGGKLRIIF